MHKRGNPQDQCPSFRNTCQPIGAPAGISARGFGSIPVSPRKRLSLVVMQCRTSLWHQVCVKLWVWQRNAPKVDRLQRPTEQLEKRVDRHPDEIEKKPSTLAPKSGEPTVLIPIEQQIQQRA